MTDQGTPSVDWASLAAQAQPRRKSVALCLRGDIQAQLELARDAGNAEQVADLENQVREATVEFVVRGMTRDKYRALEAAHPDPEGGGGWNLATFPEALVRGCLLEPSVAPEDPLFGILTPAQTDMLFEAAFLSCNEVDDLPLPKPG